MFSAFNPITPDVQQILQDFQCLFEHFAEARRYRGNLCVNCEEIHKIRMVLRIALPSTV